MRLPPSRMPCVAVVGAGNAGQAIAGYITAQGRATAILYDKSDQAILPVVQRGGVELVGPLVSGFQALLGTTSIGEAVAGSDIVLVSVPATEHQSVARDLAPWVRNGQCVVLCPGYVGGTLILRQQLMHLGANRLPMIAETTTMPFASRLVGKGSVGIKGVKKVVHLAAMPASDTGRVVEMLSSLFPGTLAAGQNALQVGLNNPNPIMHVPLTVMNWGRIEGREFRSHFDCHEWVTSGVRRVIDGVDAERVRLMESLGLTPIAHEEFAAMTYDRPWHIVEALERLPASAWTIPPRFLDEDVPCGLVPIQSLAEFTGVETPLIIALVGIASVLRGRDFLSDGRTVGSLGLNGLSRSDILEFVERG